MLTLTLLAAVGLVAGVQNALAGGGSFLIFPVLLLSGLGPRAANITSTVALFPGQLATGYSARDAVGGVGELRIRTLLLISLIGGALGAVLLLATPSDFFTLLVPWLVLFATVVFAWGSFFRRADDSRRRQLSANQALWVQLVIAIYGGYFGGGIGILMLAALTLSGLPVRNAWATKNLLAAVMNASAVLIFVFSPDVAWRQTLAVGGGAIVGGQIGVYAFRRVNEKFLRLCITALGLALTVGLFLRAYGG